MQLSIQTRTRLAWFSILIMLGTTAFIAATYGNGQELVRLRNSFIADVGALEDFNWNPNTIPKDFMLEKEQAPPEIRNAVDKILTQPTSSLGAFETALNLAKHLDKGAHPNGDGIQSNTLDTYKTILDSDNGFCADYSQVMNGLATTANIPVREWGMSFDGFGGNGHAFNEIFDDKMGKWVFVDTYYSFYVRNSATDSPLSVLELQEFLRSNASDENVVVVPIDQEHFKFKTAEKALRYYRRGADQFYLYFGNNVYTYDKHPLLSFLGGISRTLEQSFAILLGLHPEIRIVPTDTNGKWVDYLFHKRHLFFIGIIVLLSSLSASYIFARNLKRQ